MARHTDLPLKKLGSRPGSLGSYAGLTLGTPIITLEIPRTHDDRDGPTLWRRYGEMMLAAIAYRSR
jgi:protein MpaA